MLFKKPGTEIEVARIRVPTARRYSPNKVLSQQMKVIRGNPTCDLISMLD